MSATSSTESVGSLLIDLRANVAQLQTDMDGVKNIIAKSSREMSSQMKADMTETRQVLALMRDDFGVGVPRELRKVIASSELARTAILGIKDALYAIAFINLGIEAFQKIAGWLAEAKKSAEEEAKHTHDIAEAAQKAVEATIQRGEKLALIGKGEEERAALQKKFFQDELEHSSAILKGLQAQIQAKILLMNIEAERASAPDTSNAGGEFAGGNVLSAGDPAAGDKVREERLKEISALAAKLAPEISAAQKAIDDAVAGAKTNALQLHDYLQALGLDRIKNEEKVALARVDLEKTTAQKLMELNKQDIGKESSLLEDAENERFRIQQVSLARSIDILQQDPSRNKEKIKADQADIEANFYKHEQKLVEIYAATIAQIRALNEHATHDIGILSQPIGKSAVQQGAADFEAGSKLAAQQGKQLQDIMDSLRTPMQIYQEQLATIAALMEKWQKFPLSPQMAALRNEIVRLNPDFQKLQQASAEFGKDLSNELSNLVTKGETFHDFLLNVVKDLEQIALKALLLKPLENLFSGGSSGTSGVPGILAHLLGFAQGGDPPVGQISMVGERGPELFVPHSAGTIIPNNSLGGGVTNNFYIDAKGAAAGSEQAIIRGVQRALEQNVQKSMASMLDYQRRR
jgi:hypothetical protein